jgi:hypothetical protein
MSNLHAFVTTIGVSLAVSTVVLLAILQPLRQVLGLLCRSGEALPFWQAFTIVMLYAVPVFFAMLWVPFESEPVTIVRVALASSLLGLIGGLTIIGFKVAGAKPQ